jgi:hypothetical protein
MGDIEREKLKHFLAPMEKHCIAPSFPIGFPFKDEEMFDSKLNELMPILGAGTKEDLAGFLGIESGEIDVAREKKTFPSAWLVRLFEAAQKLKTT